MRIVDPDSDEFRKTAHHFPYFFLNKYAALEKKSGFAYAILCNEGQTYIPLKISKRFIFHVGIFTHAPINVSKVLTVEEEKKFLEEACLFAAKQFNCIRIEPASTISLYQANPDDSKFIELGLFTVDLTKMEEEVFASFNPTYRNEIRQAEKGGIEIRHGKEEVKSFYQCYADTHKRQKIAHEGQSFFEHFYDSLGEENVMCANAYYKGSLEAGVFLAFTDYAGYYLYAGSVAKPQLKGSTKKILWDCMKAMKLKGVRKFVLGGARYKNVEGTKYEGIQNFKRRFGASITDGYLWKKDLNRFGCALYDALFWIRCKLRGASVPKDIIDSQF